MNKEEIERYRIREYYMIPVEVVDNIFYSFEQENKQLKDNWNELKRIAKSQSDFKLKCKHGSLWFEVDELLNKMEELEDK